MKTLKTIFLTLSLLIVGGGNYAKADPISDVSQFSNNKVYTVHAQRGYWYVDNNNMLCTTSSATAPTKVTDAYKFAIISYNDNFYIYSLKAQGFMCRHDNKGYFINDIGNAFRFEVNTNGDYKLIARMKYPASSNGAGSMLTINDNNSGSIGLDSWSPADGGNRLCIEEVEDFDPTTALSLFTSDTEFNSHKVYTVSCPRGTWSASADGNSLSTTNVNTAASDEDQQFAVLKINGQYYIYNVGTEKFLMKDGSLQDVKGDPMEYFVRLSNGNKAFFFTENSVFLNMQGGGNSYALNGYNTPDDGNATSFTEVNKDVYDDAIAVFYGSQSVTYNIKINGTIIATEEREQKVGDEASLTSNYTNKEYVTYSYSPSTITIGTTSVDVTATVGTLPFEVSTDFATAKWYNLKIGSNQRYVGKEESEPYHTHAASDDSEQDATELVRATTAYQWAFIGNPVTGFKILNKEAGESYSLTSEGTSRNAYDNADAPNTVLRSGNYYWDLHENGEGFSLNLIGKSNYYINTHGGPVGYFQIWQSGGAKTDGGSRMTVEDVPDLETTITYNISYNGNVVYTEEVEGVVGGTLGSLPSGAVRDYVNITDFNGETEVTRDMTVNLTATWDGPFELSNSYATAHWYDMAIRSTWYVTSDNKDGSGALKTVNANALGLGEDAYQWAFVGDPYHIKVYNKAEGDTKVFNASGSEADQGIPSFKTDNYYWKIVASTSGISNSFLLNVPGTNLYINQYGGAGGSLKFWNSSNNLSDGGSAFTVFDVPDDYATYVASEIAPYVSSDAKYFVLKPAVKATVGYDPSYSLSCTFAQYKAMKLALADIDLNDIDNFILPETGYYRFKNVNYNKYLGLKGTTVYGNYTGDDETSAATVVKLTKGTGDNAGKYSIQVQEKYLQGLTQSKDVPLADDAAWFTPAIPTVGTGTFSTTPESTHTYIHCAGGGNIVGWTVDAAASKWTLADATSINVTISDAGYATLYVPFPVTIPSGVKAYAVGSLTDGLLNLAEITTTIPTGTPVILEGNAGTYAFDIAEEVAAYSGDNKLEGSYLQKAADNGSYVLQKQNDKVGFYKVDTQVAQPNVPANRAYLPAQDGGVKAFYFGDVETAIKSVMDGVAAGEVYDLSGRKVSKLQRGVNIVNGKKVIVK